MTISVEGKLTSMRGNPLAENWSIELQRVMSAKSEIFDKPHVWPNGKTLRTHEIVHAGGLFWRHRKSTDLKTGLPYMGLLIGLVSESEEVQRVLSAINVGLETKNKYAGFFAKDESGTVYLCHSGKGHKPKVEFHKWAVLNGYEQHSFESDSGAESGLLITAIDDTNAVQNLHRFATMMEGFLDGGDEARQRIEDDHETEINARDDLGETHKKVLIKARRGQDRYRKSVLDLGAKCRVTGVTDRNLLIASHIKPWVDSNDREKLDGNNGLPLSPHIDELFDQGLITFKDNGEMLTSLRLGHDVLKRWSVDVGTKIDPLNEHQADYMKYHRENVFQADED